MTIPIQALKSLYVGQTAWVVGKGPSLLNVSSATFGYGPVITLNEAVVPIEALDLPNTIYAMYKDGCGIKTKHAICSDELLRPEDVRPIHAALLVHEYESKYCMQDYQPRYIFDMIQDFSMPWYTFSSKASIDIAMLMGCTSMVFVAHDAVTNGDCRAVIPHIDGTYTITQHEGGYTIQRGLLLQHLVDRAMEYKFI